MGMLRKLFGTMKDLDRARNKQHHADLRAKVKPLANEPWDNLSEEEKIDRRALAIMDEKFGEGAVPKWFASDIRDHAREKLAEEGRL